MSIMVARNSSAGLGWHFDRRRRYCIEHHAKTYASCRLHPDTMSEHLRTSIRQIKVATHVSHMLT